MIYFCSIFAIIFPTIYTEFVYPVISHPTKCVEQKKTSTVFIMLGWRRQNKRCSDNTVFIMFLYNRCYVCWHFCTKKARTISGWQNVSFSGKTLRVWTIYLKNGGSSWLPVFLMKSWMIFLVIARGFYGTNDTRFP